MAEPSDAESEEEAKTQPAGICGLKNATGSICYFNAGMQCLLSCSQLRNFVISGQLGQMMQNRPENNFLSIFEQHIGLMWFGRLHDCKEMWSEFVRKHQGFEDLLVHHDVHEMIMAMIDSLHDCLKRTPTARPPGAQRPPGSILHRAKMAWQECHRSPIFQMFYGQTISKLQCGQCRHVSATFEVFNCLQLPLVPEVKGNRISSVYDCLAAYFQPERMLESSCEKCKNKGNLTKTTAIQRLPSTLILSLTRMTGGDVKNDTHVDYPVTNLSMRQWCHEGCAGPAGPYQLRSVATHEGTPVRGHNTALVINNTFDRQPVWLEMNDSRVTVISLNDVVTRSAYVLFYQR